MHSNLECFGDCVGLESCVDLISDFDELIPVNSSGSGGRKVGGGGCGGGGGGGCGGGGGGKKKKLEKEYPPPITALVRTGNLPSHMPWVMKRHYTSDGRLVITEEKVKHHEYFIADRNDGRLTLRLVPFDEENIFNSGEILEQEDNKESNSVMMGCEFPEENVDQEELEAMPYEEEVGCMKEETEVVVDGGAGEGAGVELYGGCEGFRRVSCRYGMAISPTLSPVHI